MFLEDLVLTLLTKLLRPYIADLTREKLRVGVWSGNVVLTDLQLRDEALDALGLPVRLQCGRIGRLQIRVPWSRLRSESVEIAVEDISVLACMREVPEAGAHERREMLQKRMRLDTEEALRKLRESMSSRTSYLGGSVLSRLGRAVIDNVRFQLLRLHVRYEHPTPQGDDGFACGLTLQRLEVSSTDVDHEDEASKDHDEGGPQSHTRDWLHRVVHVCSVSIYWHANAPARDLHVELLGRAIAVQLPEPESVAVLLPATDLMVHVWALRSGALRQSHEPRQRCACRVTQPVDISLLSLQLRGMMQLSTHLGRLAQRERYCALRAAFSLDNDVAAQATRWLRFAIQCVLQDLRGQRRWLPWIEVRSFVRQRREYIPLWRDVLDGELPTAARLLELEEGLRLHEILLFRALAEVRLERSGHVPMALEKPQSESANGDHELSFHRSVSDGQLLSHHNRVHSQNGVAQVASALTSREWQLQLKWRSLRVTLCSPAQAETHMPLTTTRNVAELELSGFTLLFHSELGGCTSTHLVLETLSLRGSGGAAWLSQGSTAPHFEARVPLRELLDRSGRSRPHSSKLISSSEALDLLVETWPSAHSWETTDPLQPGAEAGFQLSAAVAPLRVRFLPRTSLPLFSWLAPLQGIETAPSPLVTAPSPCHASLELAMGGALVELINDTAAAFAEVGSSSSSPPPDTDVLQLRIGMVRLFPRPSSLSKQNSPSTSLSRLQELTEEGDAKGLPFSPFRRGMCEQLSVEGVQLTLTERYGHVAWPLVLPFDLSAGIEQRAFNGTNESVLRVMLLHIRLALGQRQIEALARLMDCVCGAQAAIAVAQARGSHMGLRPLSPPPLAPSPWVLPIRLAFNVERVTLDLQVGFAKACLVLLRICLEVGITREFPSPQLEADFSLNSMEVQLRHLREMIVAQLLLLQLSIAYRSGGISSVGSQTRLEASTFHFDVLGNAAPGPPGTVTSAPLSVTIGLAPGVSGCTITVMEEADHLVISVDVRRWSFALGDISVAAQPILGLLMLLDHLHKQLRAAVGATVESVLPDSKADKRSNLKSMTIQGSLHQLAIDVLIGGATYAHAPLHSENSSPCTLARFALEVDSIGGSMAVQNETPVRAELEIVSCGILRTTCLPHMKARPTELLRLLRFKTVFRLASAARVHVDAKLGSMELMVRHDQLDELKAYWARCTSYRPLLDPFLNQAEKIADAPSLSSEPCSHISATFHLQRVALEVVAPSFPEDGDEAALVDDRDSLRHRLVFTLEELEMCWHDRGPDQQSATLHFDAFRILTGVIRGSHAQEKLTPRSRARMRKLAVVLVEIASASAASEDAIEPARLPVGHERPCLALEIQPGMFYCQVGYPVIELRIGFSEVDIFVRTWVPRLHILLSSIKLPEASDIPFVVDLNFGSTRAVLQKDEEEGVEAGLVARFGVVCRLDMAGGVTSNPHLGLQILVQSCMFLSLHEGRSSSIFPPIDAVLRYRKNGNRVRAVFQCSDVQFLIARSLLLVLSVLHERCQQVVHAFNLALDVTIDNPSDAFAVPLNATSKSAINGTEVDHASETSSQSEYFDAMEDFVSHTEFETSRPAPENIGSSLTAAGQALSQRRIGEGKRDARAEVHMGRITVTLVNDSGHSVGTPLLQLSISVESALYLHGDSGVSCANARLWLALNNFKRQRRRAPQGWESVLSPCPIDISVDCSRSALSLGSRGFVQLDLSSSFLHTLLSLQQQLGLTEHNDTPLLPISGFRLQNDTGSTLTLAFDDETPKKISAGSTAIFPESSSPTAHARKLQVTFKGFMPIEMGPPYRDRYRLWPSAHGVASPPIIYVLVSTSLENTSITLHSPYVLKNCSPAPVNILLTQDDGSGFGHPNFDGGPRQLATGERLAVPFSMLPCWLDVHQPENCSAREEDYTPPERLELALAAMQNLRTRGAMLLGDGCTGHSKGVCYTVTASYSSSGWLVSLHAPLVLHNALLQTLEYELSDTNVDAGNEIHISCGTIKRDASVAIYRPCRPGLYLRTRSERFHWSQPIDICLPESENEGVHPLHCPSAESAATHFGPIEHGAPELCLRASVARSSHTVSIEVSGHLWLVNECHIALRCQPVGLGACSFWQHLPSSGEVGTPVPLMSSSEECDLLISTALLQESSVKPTDSKLQAAIISISELLQADAQSEELVLEVHELETDSLKGNIQTRAACLHIGAKLLPLQNKLNSSMILILSPRFVIVNHTNQPIQCAQANCESSLTLLRASCPGHTDDWMAFHGLNSRNRHMVFRRTGRGAEWSGAVPLPSVASAPNELTLRLRNLETGGEEFPRVSMHRLQGRATTAVVIRDELHESAPMLIQNLTNHEVCFRQAGVPVPCSVQAGESCKYAWDDPSSRQELYFAVPSLRIRFRCDLSPRRIVRPMLAWRFPGFSRVRPRVELSVVSEGAVTRFVLSELSDERPALHHPISSVRVRKYVSEAADGGSGSSWQLKVELPGIGMTLIDNSPRELLHHSLRGVRFTARASLHEATPRVSMALAIASVQLDSQLPRESALQEVLLQSGIAERVDALSAQLTISPQIDLPVVHQACITLQEITLRLDEQVLDTVASVLQAQVVDSLETPIPSSPACMTSALLRNGIVGELAQAALEVSGKRIFVKQLRLNPIKLKLSWKSSRPDAPLPENEREARAADSTERGLSFSMLRWLRWLGITLIGLEDAPVRLPEVALQRVVLPVESLLADLEQRYSRALVGAVQKLLLPSAALLGDPYGTLRTLQQAWMKQRQKLRRTPWRRWPLVALQSASLLLRALAANMLSASGRSVVTLAAGLEAFLSQESEVLMHKHVTLPEALLQGIGGLAKEAAQALDTILAAARQRITLPTPIEGILISVLLPFGLCKGIQRLAIVMTVCTLRTLRSSADIVQGLLQSGWTSAKAPGRARPPRIMARSQLIQPYRDTGASVYSRAAQLVHGWQGSLAQDIVCCMECPNPLGSVLVLTKTSLLWFAHGSAYPLEVQLKNVLLFQQQTKWIRVLYLLPQDPRLQHTQARDFMALHEMELMSTSAAEDFCETLRIMCLNARELPLSPIPSCPLLRSVLFLPPRRMGPL